MNFLRLLRRLFIDQYGWTSEMNVTGVAEIDAVIPEFWADGIIPDGSRESFWGALSGAEGSRMPCIIKTGKLKQKGDLITFSTIQRLMGTGRTGENVLKGYEEKLGVGTFTVTVDFIRHAVAVSKKSNKQANYDQVSQVGEELRDWSARKSDTDIFSLITGSSAVQTLYAGDGNTSEAGLNATDGDHFGINEIEMIRLALIRQGAVPLKVITENGRKHPVYGIAYGDIEEYRLSQNTVFVQALREALTRFSKGGSHPLFSGAIGMYRNMLFYPYYSALPLPQGTPLRPETTVYATLNTTPTILSVGGASEAGPASEDVTPDYTLFFASSGSLQIDDEILSYSAKGKNYFTISGRGASSTTAAIHSADKLVTQRNIATVIGFGAEGVFKAIPQEATPIGEKGDYGAQIGLGIEAYYGQAIRIDTRRQKCPSLVKMKVYSANPGTV